MKPGHLQASIALAAVCIVFLYHTIAKRSATEGWHAPTANAAQAPADILALAKEDPTNACRSAIDQRDYRFLGVLFGMKLQVPGMQVVAGESDVLVRQLVVGDVLNDDTKRAFLIATDYATGYNAAMLAYYREHKLSMHGLTPNAPTTP